MFILPDKLTHSNVWRVYEGAIRLFSFGLFKEFSLQQILGGLSCGSRSVEFGPNLAVGLEDLRAKRSASNS